MEAHSSLMPQSKFSIWLRRSLFIASIFLSILLSWYFRTEVLRAVPEEAAQRIAEDAVFQQITQQVKQSLFGLLPQNIAPEIKDQIVEERVQAILQADETQHQKTVESFTREFRKGNPSRHFRSYLSGADSYYYLSLTQKVLEDGKLGSEVKDGRYYNPLREAPEGAWALMTLHPYLGALWYKAYRLVDPKSSLMGALCYFPLSLMVLVCIAFFYVAKALRFGLVASFVSCLSLSLAPFFIQRSAYGWYDTDLYQHLFPLAFSSTYCLEI